MEENKREIKKEEIKLLIYLEDNDEVKNKTGFAAKIGAVTDAARQLKLKT